MFLVGYYAVKGIQVAAPVLVLESHLMTLTLIDQYHELHIALQAKLDFPSSPELSHRHLLVIHIHIGY